MFTVLMFISLISYATFVESGKEKTRIGTIGALLVEVVPNATSVGTETIKITFNAPGKIDFTGWEINDGADFSHIISADAVSSGETLLICGESTPGFDCDDVWGESNSLSDTNGSLYLFDGQTLISTVIYTDPGAGGSSADSPLVSGTILDANASVQYCRATKQGLFASHRGNVSTIIDGKSHSAPDSESIIPSFYYDTGSGVSYYSGLNWPDTTGLYSQNCSA